MSSQTPVITSSIQETAIVLLSADNRLSTGSQGLAVRTAALLPLLAASSVMLVQLFLRLWFNMKIDQHWKRNSIMVFYLLSDL